MPMRDVAESPVASRVQLEDVRTPEQFVAAMRLRKAMSGLTYLELERRADAVGDELSPEAALVGVDGMPSERLVAAFVRACGGAPDEVATWVAAHRRIPAATLVPTAIPPPVQQGNAARAWLLDLLPPVFVHARRPVRMLAVAVAALLLATVAGVWVTSGPFEEYGVFPMAAPDEDGEADDETADAPTPSPQGAVRKNPRPSTSRPPATTAPPSPTETLPEDYYPSPDDGDRYPPPSPTDEPPTEEWPGGGDDGGSYCEPYPSPVCHHS